ncbi:MAG TPA: MlaD family protein [Solirubrobacterales bacterium]|nr:MlaD family protein [Solirubrobacterales bacterium]
MKKALRTYTRDFIAILVLGAIGLLALFVILSQQSTALPSWFPFLGEDRFELKTEFQTAQAVTPGQGQTVNLSGVEIGDVTNVELEDGVAVVTMQVDPEFAGLIHPDASALLRPRTGLQDMTIELDAGTEEGEIPEGFTIPLANTEPNINPDQILASLDGDTRAYLKLLLAGGAEALGSQEKSENFAQVLRRLYPTVRDIAKINGAIAERRDNLRRVITNFKLIAEELAKSDTNLTGFVESQNEVFGAFAESEADLRATLRELPGALRATRGALNAGATLSGELRPALIDLLPQARALGPALRATRPFFRQTEPAIRTQLRPFTKNVDTFISDVRRASKPLEQSSKQLEGGFTELNQLVNALGYNPSGPSEGYLFYLSWLNHNTNASFLTQDGLGPLRRGLFTYTCFTSQLADNLVASRPSLKTARELTRLPTTTEICPKLFKAQAEAGAGEAGDRAPSGAETTTDETTTTESTTTDPVETTDSTETTTTGPEADSATTAPDASAETTTETAP